jgi:hypothetical protein
VVSWIGRGSSWSALPPPARRRCDEPRSSSPTSSWWTSISAPSGFELVRRLHSQTSLDPSRAILISTYAEEDFADLITASPAAGFLSKSDLSARAVRDILGTTADDDPADDSG